MQEQGTVTNCSFCLGEFTQGHCIVKYFEIDHPHKVYLIHKHCERTFLKEHHSWEVFYGGEKEA
jgi:hypothetical protein